MDKSSCTAEGETVAIIMRRRGGDPRSALQKGPWLLAFNKNNYNAVVFVDGYMVWCVRFDFYPAHPSVASCAVHEL